MSQYPEPSRAEAEVGRPKRGMAPGRLMRLSLKELREILRDRRTIITLVLMPLFVYPLLSVAFQKFLISQLSAPTDVHYRIAISNEQERHRVEEYVGRGDYLLAARREANDDDENPDGADQHTGAPGPPRLTWVFPKYENEDENDHQTAILEGQVANGIADLGIRWEADEQAGHLPLTNLPPHQFELVYRDDSISSIEALHFIEARLEAVNDEYLRHRLRGFGESRPPPATVTTTQVARPDDAPHSLSTLIPLILILMTVTGAVYPAIDLTAGERERGTLETLIAAPVPRMGLLFAKYVAVVAVAILTATVNLLAMTATVYGIGLESLLFGTTGPHLGVIVQVFLLMILFAAFFSAVLLVLTSFARSFKEAQAYLIPLMMVSIAPGLLALTPGLELSGLLTVVPLVNIVLLSRDVFEGSASFISAASAVCSTIVYSTIALNVAARIFGTDAVLFGSQGTWSDLFRRPGHESARPSVTVASIIVASVFPLFILLSSIPGRFEDLSMSSRLVISAGVPALLFTMLPIFAARWGRVRMRDAFLMKAPTPLALFAAALLGASLWTVAYEITVLPFSATAGGIESLLERFQDLPLLAQFGEIPLALKLFSIALLPAVCEEFFFRGFLMGALRGRYSDRGAILTSAIVFGLFHVVVQDSLFLERLLPSTLMGVVLGWVCVRTGSLFPGMLLHVLHNGLTLTFSHFFDRLQSIGVGSSQQIHLPISWMLAAILVVAAGFWLLHCVPRPDNPTYPTTKVVRDAA